LRHFFAGVALAKIARHVYYTVQIYPGVVRTAKAVQTMEGDFLLMLLREDVHQLLSWEI
jgi:hypothetical protein